MNQIPVTNTTEHNMHVGGHVLRPGETMHVDAHLVPPGKGETSAPADTAPPLNHVQELQKAKSAIVIAELTALSLDDLHALEALEASANTPRKGVLEAITAEHLRRASEEGDNGDNNGGDNGASEEGDDGDNNGGDNGASE